MFFFFWENFETFENLCSIIIYELKMIDRLQHMGLIHRYVRITRPRLYLLEYTTLHIQYNVISNLLSDQTRIYLLNVLLASLYSETRKTVISCKSSTLFFLQNVFFFLSSHNYCNYNINNNSKFFTVLMKKRTIFYCLLRFTF